MAILHETVNIVAGTLLRKSGKILLVREAGGGRLSKGRWGLPAGKVRQGETLAGTAARETREETGHSVRVGEHFFTYHAGPGESVKHAFRGTITGGSLRVKPNSEISEARWHSMKDILTLSRRGKLRPWVLPAIRAFQKRA